MKRMLLILVFFFISANTFAADLVAIQFQPGPQKTRIIFTLTENTKGEIHFATHPNRLIVDFKNTNKKFEMQNARLLGSNVTSIDADELNDGTTRFIFYVTSKPTWDVTVAPKNADDGVKVTLDIITIDLPRQSNAVVPATTAVVPRLDRGTQQAANGNLQQTFQQSAENTFSVLMREVKEKQEQGSELLGQARIQEKTNKTTQLIVVIDPGHGGRDVGAKGYEGALEKNVVLEIAKKLAQQINSQNNMRAVLTRNDDEYLPLRKRLQIARKNNADLFIAIHADAYFDPNAYGASVYAISQRGTTSEAARWLAQQENYSELGDVQFDSLPDRSPMIRSVLIDLAQTVTNRNSLRLGTSLLNALNNVTNLHYKKVEQAPFVVLKSPDITSVLIEIGFISNPGEEQRLLDASYQDKLVSAIWNGIQQYQEKFTRT